MTTNEANKDMDVLKEELAKLRKDMGELVTTVKDMGKHRVGDVRDKAQAELDRRLQQLNEAYESIRREGGRAADSVSHTVEERPLTSLAVAFVAGLIFGRVFSIGTK